MHAEKKRFVITDILLIVIGAVFLFGLIFAFHACDPKGDGSFMTCHWAERAVEGVAAAAFVLTVIHLFVVESGIKSGIDIALIVLAVLSGVIPGRLISLCMMPDMRCRSTMQPAVIVCAIILAVCAIADYLVIRKRGRT